MSHSRFEFEVGVFVFVGLLLIAGLLLRFTKGTTFLRPTTDIVLNVANVGGLRRNASVQLSGVQVGTVDQVVLSPSGTNVAMTLKIYKEYLVKDDARFTIETSGFLGDQYVAIYPGNNPLAKPLTNGSVAYADPPFNIQEFTRDAAGFVERIDDTAKKLDAAITDIRRDVLNDNTLTNLAYSLNSLQKVADDATGLVKNFDSLVDSNRAPIGQVMTNLIVFSDRLKELSLSAQGVVNSNQAQIAEAVSNLEISTAMLTNLLGQAQTGKGMAGLLLRNEQFADSVSTFASNLAAASGNLRSNGLWAFLWHPRTANTNPPPARAEFPGRTLDH